MAGGPLGLLGVAAALLAGCAPTPAVVLGPDTSLSPAVGRAHVVPAPGVAVPDVVLAEVARTADRGARAVDAAWGDSWGRPVTVVVADRATLAAALGPASGAKAVAVTVATADPVGSQVLLDQQAWSALPPTGRLVVLTHELVHVATGSAQQPLPLWLEEGLAEYVGWLGSGVPVTVAAREAVVGVAAGGLPHRLPDAAAFDLTGGGAAAAYGQAYVAVRLLAQTYGAGAPVTVYRRAADALTSTAGGAAPPPDAAVEEALRSVTGHGLPALVSAWRAELARLAP